MPIPDESRWKSIEGDFSQKWNYPNCIGALDGKYVQIFAPPKTGSLYFNYKKFFSIMLLALVDADYKFIYVNVGEQGKNSDAGIYSRSDLAEKLENNTLNIPAPKSPPGTDVKLPHVVGDEAFPSKPYLMRPYPGSQLHDLSKKVYNYRHSRARRVSENAFGILCQKSRIYYRKMCLIPKRAENVILATCVLHNFLRNEAAVFENEEPGDIQLQDLVRTGGNFVNSAIQVRESFKEYFSSPEGSVVWQNDSAAQGCQRRDN
ncbi:protein ALP1-like isoform X2 [Rhagoletis pomonella]|uniref:protein ALP1-like isoform X1 n=1 Tax=Rhagoletis pomonella TaxID=28610 RepID=UPI0017876E91|nr:protein ALP1-like isoform X1 [Rhagoletis pomonella]XP_036340162.1 protein ALP1-like isoform X2 [Rhagoletis pomonella]